MFLLGLLSAFDNRYQAAQRFFVTDKCKRFLKENDNRSRTSAQIIGHIFEGIDEKNLAVTIDTIMKA